MLDPTSTSEFDYSSAPALPSGAPVEEHQTFDFAGARSKDLDLFLEWKKNPSKTNMGALIKQVSPLIYSEVRRAAGTLPESALSGEAKKWAIRGIQTFDPSKGAALSTHIVNNLMKVRRMNYSLQNAARLPENLQLQYTTFKNAASHLETKLGREPKDEELAKHLGWSKPSVIKFRGQLYDDLVESSSQRAHEASHFNEDKFLMDHIISNLTEEEKVILFNSKEMSVQQLADKLGVNVSRFNYLKSKLKNKIAAIKTEIGMY